jgi:hypothetical protein
MYIFNKNIHIIIYTIIRHAQVLGLGHRGMTVERSFSTLWRLKTWFRSMMTENKLSALCLINVYHKVDILDQIDHIIDIFANFQKRLLEFVL